MKRMKGIAAMEASPYLVSEDPRTRFKFQSLLQDYQDLQKETDLMKKRMQLMKEKKMTLMAEVRFLRRRYNYLTKNQLSNPWRPQDPMPYQSPALPNTIGVHSKKNTIGVHSKKNVPSKTNKAKVTNRKHLGPSFDINKKQKVSNGKQVTFIDPVHIFNSNQERTIAGKEAAPRRSTPIMLDLNKGDLFPARNESNIQSLLPPFDLNRVERLQSGKEASTRKPTPIFDLNQISRDEEELQMDGDQLAYEEPKDSIVIGRSEEMHSEVKLPGCRNTGNGINRAGKRKISWQDQVALRV